MTCRLIKSILLTTLLGLQIIASAQNTKAIHGKVIDTKTKQALPYASITIANKHIGTVSNSKGNFTLHYPDSVASDTLIVTYLGYNTYTQPLKNFSNKAVKIKLNTSSTEINEVVIRPLTPLEVIKKVKANYKQNYPQTPYISKGFFLQEVTENNKYVDFIEAYVDIYNPAFGDTSKCQAKLIQGRTRENLTNIQFLKQFMEAKHDKAIKKAERKGDSIDPNIEPGVGISFGGPVSIANDDFIRNIDDISDKKTLKKFKFSYGNNTHLADRELIVINCEGKKPVNNMMINAKLYIDKESYALVLVKSSMLPRIPLAIKPVLKVYRIKLHSFEFKQLIEYRHIDNIWYPNKTITTASVDVQKKYKGHYLERSNIKIRKAFISTDIENSNVQEFTAEEQITDKPLHEQLGNYDPDFWKNKNKIEYEIAE